MLRMLFAPILHPCLPYVYRWGWQDHLRVLEAVAVRAHALLNSHIA